MKLLRVFAAFISSSLLSAGAIASESYCEVIDTTKHSGFTGFVANTDGFDDIDLVVDGSAVYQDVYDKNVLSADTYPQYPIQWDDPQIHRFEVLSLADIRQIRGIDKSIRYDAIGDSIPCKLHATGTISDLMDQLNTRLNEALSNGKGVVTIDLSYCPSLRPSREYQEELLAQIRSQSSLSIVDGLRSIVNFFINTEDTVAQAEVRYDRDRRAHGNFFYPSDLRHIIKPGAQPCRTSHSTQF